MDDAAKAGSYLKKAFDYRANTLPGETLPDPRTDDSFKKLMYNNPTPKCWDLKDWRREWDSLPQLVKSPTKLGNRAIFLVFSRILNLCITGVP